MAFTLLPSSDLTMHCPLTDGARRVLQLAAVAAQHDGVADFDADYVLLGLAHYREVLGISRMASLILAELNVSLDGFAKCFAPRPREESAPQAGPMAEFIKAAFVEAENLHLSGVAVPLCIGTEHLLLAIARSDSRAAEYLRGAGADYERIRRAIVLLGLDVAAAASSALPERSEYSEADDIEQALNRGAALEHPDLQAVANLRIVAGGLTRRGDYLYDCEAELVWRVNSAECTASFRRELRAEFRKGDFVTALRIGVRLEKAGQDLVVAEATILPLGSNPLSRD